MSEKTHSSDWVWISTEDSIQRGQISLLALLEIPLAMAFFWWLSSLSPWPWLTLIGLMAAPMLLLRSPESVEAGKEMLGRYLENDEVSISQDRLITLLAMSLIVGLSYWGTQHFLLEQPGWKIFWRGAMLGGFLLALLIAFTSAIVTTPAVTIVFTLALLVAIAVAGSIAGAMAGASVGTGIGMLLLINNITKKYFFTPILPPAMALGFFVRAVFIRLWATLQYWNLGLAAFPRNWRETVCVIDARHLPELLPGAGEISDAFSLQGLHKYKIRGKFNDKIFDLLLLTILAPLIYLPALLYRWNLKASAWLWGTAAKIATPHNPAIIYKPGDGVVSSGLAYVAVRACQAVVC